MRHELMAGICEDTDEMGSGAMTCTESFIKFDSGI
jgi:hypothetical protein